MIIPRARHGPGAAPMRSLAILRRRLRPSIARLLRRPGRTPPTIRRRLRQRHPRRHRHPPGRHHDRHHHRPDKHTSESSTYDAAKQTHRESHLHPRRKQHPVSGIVYGRDNVPAFKAVVQARRRTTASARRTTTPSTISSSAASPTNLAPTAKLLHIHAFDSQGNELREDDAYPDERQSLPRVH